MIRLLLAATLAVGAFPAGALAAVKNPDTFTYLTIGDADSLDPAIAYDTASHMVILNIYEPLFFFDGVSTEKLVPIIASKVPSQANGLISADGKTYTIPIRKGVKFHDGSLMTPEDVRYSILRFILADRAAGPSSLLLEPLLGYPGTRDEKEKIKAGVWKDAAAAVSLKGDDLILKLPKPYAPLLSILASWAPVVSKAWAVKNGDWDGTEDGFKKWNNPKKEGTAFFDKANGTGAFTFERWDRRTKEVHLLRNDAYWRTPAKLKRVIIKGLNEVGTRKLMLSAGDADTVYADRSSFSQFQDLPGVRIIDDLPSMEINPVVFFTFKINAAGNPNVGSGRLDGAGIPPTFFSDLDVRKGFAYAFDYAGYIKDVFAGKAIQATGIIPASLPGHNPKQQTYTMDLTKAAEHFKKAWGGQIWDKGFKFTLTFNSGNVPRQNLCQILKTNIEKINPKFQIDVRAIEWPTFLDSYRASKLPIFVLGWNADYPDPHNFAFPLLHSKGDYAGTQKFSNPGFDELIDAANREASPAKRKQLYVKLQSLAFDFVPHLVLLEQFKFRPQREWVKGYYNNPVFPDAPYGSYFYHIFKE